MNDKYLSQIKANAYSNKKNSFNLKAIKTDISIFSKFIEQNKNVLLYSINQINSVIDKVIAQNKFQSLEVQKSVVANFGKDISNLTFVTVFNGNSSKKFFMTSERLEILKAFTPLNKKKNEEGEEEDDEDYMDKDENGDDDSTQEILDWIKDNPDSTISDVENKFGSEAEAILSKLHDDEVINVDEKTNIVSVVEDDDDDDDDSYDDSNNNDDNDNNQDDQNNDDNNDNNDNNLDFTQKKNKKGDDQNQDDNNQNDNDDSNNDNDDTVNNNTDQNDQNTNQDDQGDNNDQNDNNQDDQNNNQAQDQSNNINSTNPDETYSQEELQSYAKRTETDDLVKFYNSSTDEDKKNIALQELQNRGVDPANYVAGNNNDANPNNDQAQNASLENASNEEDLKKWINTYFEEYDIEDLRSYIAELIDQNPAKKDLKDKYRESYKEKNGGNEVQKVNNKDFISWVEDDYLKNFSIQDLKDYAIKLLIQSPTEISKFKKVFEALNPDLNKDQSPQNQVKDKNNF